MILAYRERMRIELDDHTDDSAWNVYETSAPRLRDAFDDLLDKLEVEHSTAWARRRYYVGSSDTSTGTWATSGPRIDGEPVVALWRYDPDNPDVILVMWLGRMAW